MVSDVNKSHFARDLRGKKERCNAMMRKKYNKIKLRAALLSLLTIALLAATAAFIGTSAANAVSDSDLAASGSDLAALTDEIPKANEIPADLGEPKIVMTTSKALGETLKFSLDISQAYVDWGDGNIVQETGTSSGDTYSYSRALVGNTVKIYSTVDITYLNCDENNLTTLDVSNCAVLKQLDCRINNLTTLDVSNNTSLNYLDCSNNNLTTLDVSKNTALGKLDCDDNNLTTLDVSKNTALEQLDCCENELTSLDVSGCTVLTRLSCSNNNLTTLDVSNNTSLDRLECGCNNLTVLDVSNNTGLTELYCSANALTTLDVSKNTALGGLYCYNNHLTELDVSKNIDLVWLHCSTNNLTTLDVSKNTVLTDLYCYENNLTELDVSKNNDLTDLYCGSNSFTTLDISNNNALTELYCGGNNLTTLDVSKNTALACLACNGNNFSTLDVSNNDALTELWFDENSLKFSTIKINKDVTYERFFYSPQADVEIAASIKANQTIDLSSEFETTGELTFKYYDDSGNSTIEKSNGGKTVYKWFDSSDSEVTPTKSENGVFTFGDEFVGKTLYCTMTNTLFPDLTLKTTNVTVGLDLGEPKIVMTTGKAVGETLEFSLDISQAYVDWGDGNIVQETGTSSYYYSYSGELVGNTVRIYSTVDITYLNCDENNLTTLDVSNATALTILSCENNNLSALDVSNNKDLCSLWCNNQSIKSINGLLNCHNLRFLWCNNNQLSEIDLSACSKIQEASFDNNQLVSLKLPVNNENNPISLSVDNNKLTSLDFSHTYVGIVSCNNNKLTSITLNNDVECFKTDPYTGLIFLYCDNNQLTSLDLSCQYNLMVLYCRNNALKLSTLQLTDKVSVYNRYEILAANQAPVSIASSIKAGQTIDLSSEYEKKGDFTFEYGDEIEKRTDTKTVYKWFDSSDSEVTPTKSENGVFTFGDEFVGKTLYCTMTNALFPDLTLKTTTVEIKEADFIIEDNVGVVEDAEPSDGIIIRDENGNIVDLNGVKLIVGNIETNKKKTVLEAIERYNNEFKADSTDCALYDISLVDKNGAKVYIDDGGRIKIKLKYPDNLGREAEDYTYHLYHQKEDGSIEEIAINCEPNGIWFYADEFSPYVLTWSLKTSGGTDTEKGPGTGESIALTIVASCLAMLSLTAIGAVIYRKKFARSAK